MPDWPEVRSRGLLDAAPDAILAVDGAGLIVLANLQAERLFGYTRGELVGRPVEMLVPAAARGAHPEHRSRYLADPRPRPMGAGRSLAARRKDGTEFPAEISLSAIPTEAGDRLVAAAIRDVSEYHRAAQAQMLLASIVQSSHDAILSMSLDGVVTSWNPSAEALFGYPAAEMMGRHVAELWPAARKAQEELVIERVSRGERVDRYRTERLRRDGTRVMVSLSLSPIVGGGQRIVGIAEVARDVGERERAQAKFLGLLEAAPDAIVGVNRDGRIVLVNAQTERLFGYSREELVGQPIEVLVPARVHDVHAAHRRRYVADPTPRHMGAGRQLTARRRDGTEFPADISLSSLETEDGLVVAAAIRDVTERLDAQAERERLKAQAERERLETRLLQAQRLESLGQLAGGVAHDFNNLLAVIVNYVAFVAEEVEELSTREPGRWQPVLSDVQQIQRAADRGIALTHQLLAFGRREVVRPRVLSLNDVVTEVKQLLHRSIGEHVRLTNVLAEELWRVRADPGQIEQILVNLAVNARDAMPSGGTLLIETCNTTLELAGTFGDLPPGRYARIRVSDTGEGMPQDVIDRAFEPFFTTKPKGEGTGLGLATVYGIVTQAGGGIRIKSRPGRGTRFDILLPATEETIAAAEPERVAAPRPGGGETVLVVEDEPAIREVTRRILGRNWYQVVIAHTAPDAVRLADDHDGPIDLLLTDVVMPHMLGKEVAERVIASRPEVRVLYMSGYARPVLASAGTLDPGVRLLEKPFTEEVLLAAVRGVLDGTG